MNIAIASGKGGTGKTTIATNLTLFLMRHTENVRYLDCDVEEPNGHLFLKPTITKTHGAWIPVPHIDQSRCTVCGECVRFCEYNALIRLGSEVIVFPELCHGCGGCTMICPKQAVSELPKEIGVVEQGYCGSAAFVQGRLTIGVAMSPPLIRNVLKQTTMDCINIIDAPPGTSCPVITSIRTADFVVLVTEPTPFGLHDLGLALDLVCALDKPHGVVINRAESGNHDAEQYCRKKSVAIIAEIPDDRRIAEAYSNGEMIIAALPEFIDTFDALWKTIQKRLTL